MTTLNNTIIDFCNEINEKFLTQFKINNNYKILSNINNSRCAIKLYKISNINVFEEHHRSGFKYFDNLNCMYLQAPIKYLMVGERIYQKEIKKIRYNLMSLDELTEYFQNTFDLFDEQGVKIKRDTIKVALYDDYFVIEIPDVHKNSKTFNILMYPHIYNDTTTKSIFKINKKDFHYSINEFILYIDGKVSNNYEISETHLNYIVRINDTINEYCEISFIRFLRNERDIRLKNNHLFLEKCDLPIPTESIICFHDGKLINLELTPVTGCIFRSQLLLNDVNFDVYYGYSSQPDDVYKYFDNYLWYYQYNKRLPEIINNSRILPEFVNAFKLYNNDISLEDFIANKYTDNFKYSIDKINDILNYNEEMLPILIHYIYETLGTNINQYNKSFIVNDYDIEYNTRHDNSVEQLDPNLQTEFLFSTVLFKFKNNENRKINIYLDGIRYNGFVHTDIVNDDIFIYVDKTKLINSEVITFEFINVSYLFQNKYNEIKVLSDGSKKCLEINNVKSVKLIDNILDTLYINCFNDTNNQMIDIINIDYNKESDVLKLYFKDTLPEGTLRIVNNNTYKVYKHHATRKGTNLTITMDDMYNIPHDINHIRVFKSGKELPRSTYEVIFPDKDSNCTTIKINCEYTICETFEVEYIPNKVLEKYSLDRVNGDGRISIYENNKKELFFNNITDYYCLNGTRLYQDKCKQWCTKGVTLHSVKTNKYFRAYQIINPLVDIILNKYINGYKINEKLFDKFIVGIMIGDMKLPSNLEPDCDKINRVNSNSIYNDIYVEFLRHNIINDNIGELPPYIAIKYKDLIKDGVLIIDANDTDKARWMPLDASAKRIEKVEEIDKLYYELLNDGESMKIMSSSDIPKEIYEKYKILFDNNVLVLQAPYIK